MASAGNFKSEKLIYNFLCNEILFQIKNYGLGKSCTIFGIKNKNGLFVGRNYDWFPEAEKFFQAYKFSNPWRKKFIAVTDMGISSGSWINVKNRFYDPDDAINEEGLYIGLTFAYNEKWSYGLTSSHLVRLVAETCSSVEDSIEIFKRVPLCSPKNFFIADENGEMVVVEHNSKKFKIIYPEENILIKTNHYLDPEMEKEDKVLKKYPFHNTFIRYYETLQRINFRK